MQIRTFVSVLALGALSTAACSDDGSARTTTLASSGGSSGTTSSSSSSSSSGSSGNPVKATEEISGAITTSRTLSADKNYLLKGLVEVKAGATLTIEKGTTLKGDNASKAILLVEPGAKLIAEGSADEPIVFTSQAAEGQRKAGDWGGVIILGKAPVNYAGGKGTVEGILKNGTSTEFGGTDADDSSGALRFVRIEYAGVVLSTDNEVNGLTLAGVGRGTKIDHVQVRHALDDCFEFFGGTVDAKYLACQYNQDDGFDFDNGYSGRLQFLVLQQDPNHAGDDNGFESDNDAQGSANGPLTNPTVYNATLLGKNKVVDGLQYGMLLRRNSRGTYRNLLVQGFAASIDIRDATTAQAALAGTLSVQNSLFYGAKGAGVLEHVAYPESGSTAPDKDNDGALDEVAWFKSVASNRAVEPRLMQPFNATTPTFGPAVMLGEGAATPPSDGFFDTTANYTGAFRDSSDTWATRGTWAVWTEK
jgi:hypothetical protein